MHLSKVWFSFSGRITRRTWWLAIVLPSYALVIFAGSVDFFLGTYDAAGGAGIFQLIACSPCCGRSCRARQTLPRPWENSLVHPHQPDPPGRCNLVFVELGFLAGTVGDNRFGPDPKMIAAPAPAGAPGWPAPGQSAPTVLHTPGSLARTTLVTTRPQGDAARAGISRAAYVASRASRDEA